VQTWLPGVVATNEDPSESVTFARDLAEFVNDVRAIDTHGRTFRGKVGEANCSPTTSGRIPASAAAKSFWTFRSCAGCGQSCGVCRAKQPAT
jgi:hypothetical protein